MASLLEIAEYYSFEHSNLLQSVYSPLNRHFNIDNLSYQHISNDGKYWGMSNDPDWAKDILQGEYCIKSPTIIAPSKISDIEFNLGDFNNHNFYSALLEHYQDAIEIRRVKFTVVKTEEGYELFSFGSRAKDNYLIDAFTNNKKTFNGFLQFFREKINNLIQDANLYNFDLATAKGDAFHQVNIEHNLLRKIRSINSFQQDIESKLSKKEHTRLSERESHCLKALIQGYTAKQTSIEMGISHRTVEGYISNIKKKFGIRTKAQILAKIVDLNLLEDI